MFLTGLPQTQLHIIMEKRAIIYSCASPDPLNFNQHWQQIPYSIETIRQHSDIPIKVYVSRGLIQNSNLKPHEMFSNVELVEFDDCLEALYPSYGTWQFAGKLDHKWKNAINMFERFDLDRVLFVDGDTFFNRSPHELFDLYDDPTVIWTREENSNYITEQIKHIVHISRFVNDGQFILPRSIARRVQHGFAKRQQKYIWDILTATEQLLSKDDHHLLHWLSSQYSITKVLDYYGIGVRFFNPRHTSLSNELMHMHQSGNCPGRTSILHHYFFGNTPRYLPQRYWCENWRPRFDLEVGNRSICSCGEYL